MQKDLARKAAKWWADCLRNGAKLDNGASDKSNLMAQSLAGMLQDKERKGRSEELIQAFEDVLYRRYVDISSDYAHMGDCDYNPDEFLFQVAVEAKCDLGMASLPWKTSMRYKNGTVEVKCGYGAAFQPL